MREVLRLDGVLQARYDYDAYGKRMTITQNAGYLGGCDFGYTGHFTRTALVAGKTELVLAHYRAYDPALGRWLSEDPLGIEGGVNLYGYVGADPANAWDPYGLASWSDHVQAFKEIGWGQRFEDLKLGAMATADGFIPFSDPFADSGSYDPCADGAGFSKNAGEFAFAAATSAGGGGSIQMLRGGRALNVVGGSGRQGIYVFKDASRGMRSYVGQARNLGNRLGQHGRGGRIGSRPKTYTVRGNQRALDSAEQQMIDQMGGVRALANKRNQIGAGRRASGYYRPRTSADTVAGAAGLAGGAIGGMCN
ncbi:RHS repeat-associated core domain-containing protein [Haloferula chungangensis]|uniref:RHS repeat-associated core domain-containing protein n=1 Tax=Haloferula chungangensis TaxID=1048331 RepID=A0ABW2LA96_9BACT